MLQSSKPPAYFCEAGATAVRLVLSAPPAPAKGAKAWVQGSPLKGDVKKPIVALATLPSDPYFLLMLTADGQLSGYTNVLLHWLIAFCMYTIFKYMQIENHQILDSFGFTRSNEDMQSVSAVYGVT